MYFWGSIEGAYPELTFVDEFNVKRAGSTKLSFYFDFEGTSGSGLEKFFFKMRKVCSIDCFKSSLIGNVPPEYSKV